MGLRLALGFDARRLRSFRALLDLKTDGLAFGQRLEAGSRDRGMMHEDILAAISRSDKAIALGIVEPLYGTSQHVNNLNKVNKLEFNCGSCRVIYRRYREGNY